MKKILLVIATGLVIVSCKNEGTTTSTNSSAENVEVGESGKTASYALGVIYAKDIDMFNQNPNKKDSLNHSEYIKGLEDFLSNPNKKESYAFGMSTGNKVQGALDNDFLKGNLDTDEIIKAIKDYLGKKDLKISADSANFVMNDYFKSLQMKAAEENKKKGIAYINNLKKQDTSLKTTESGLMYKVIQEGNGEKPTSTDYASIKYTGKTIDGEVFDSTDKNNNGNPVDMPMTAGIKGWNEGLSMMSKGAKYQLYIPSDLGYGDMGNQKIKPGETLIFDVELIDFKPAPSAPSTPGQPGVKINPVKPK